MCFAPQRRALFRHLNFQKVVRTWCVLYILTWKRASRQNGMHFFDMSTSKSAPNVRCFLLFHLQMCFAPQRRALFRHLNFQKWSGPGVFCTFWLGNLLRATTACNFSSLIWPTGSAPAALASLLCDPPEPQIIGKTHCFPTLLPFRAPGSSFFWLFLFLLLFSSLLWLFSSLLFICPCCRKFAVWLLNFLRPEGTLPYQRDITAQAHECRQHGARQHLATAAAGACGVHGAGAEKIVGPWRERVRYWEPFGKHTNKYGSHFLIIR